MDLLRLREESPGALVVSPNPYTQRRSERRFRIVLAAWATEIAGRLKATYGDVVDLQVGAMTCGRGRSSWLLAPAWMPPPSGNGELSTESSAASTPAVLAFSPLAICCWPKRIASRRSHRIVQQSGPSVPGSSSDRHPKSAVRADDHPSSKVNHGTDGSCR